MKKWLGYMFKTIAVLIGLIITAILFFAIQANLREIKNTPGSRAAHGQICASW